MSGTSSLHTLGELNKGIGTPTGKVYFVAGDTPTTLDRIDSIGYFNVTQTKFTFRLPAGHASYSYYGLEAVPTGTQSTTFKGRIQGKTAPEVKSN